MKVPQDKTVPARVGWVVRKQCGGWRAVVDCGFLGTYDKGATALDTTHLVKATLASVSQSVFPAPKHEPLSKQCAVCLSAFQSAIPLSWV